MLRHVQNSRLFTFLLLGMGLMPAAGLSESRGTATQATAAATIDGSIVSDDDLTHVVAGQLQQLRQQEYELKSKALDQLIAKRLLDVEAAKQGMSVDQLTDREVKAKVGAPTDSEVEAYYLGQRDRLQRPLSEVRPQLREALRQSRIQDGMQQYVARLRAASTIVVWLNPPRVELTGHSSRIRGNSGAPVTIVEFSDFHCPFCKRVQPSLSEVLSRYDGQVKHVFRDFPLDSLHPQARAAAEAANCAGDQGRFWEYHDLLFARAPKASSDDLKGYARTVGLNTEQFDSCVVQGTHHDAVQRDIDEATRVGMTGTPGFFINGRFLNGAQPLEKFVEIIDEELAFTQTRASPAHR